MKSYAKIAGELAPIAEMVDDKVPFGKPESGTQDGARENTNAPAEFFALFQDRSAPIIAPDQKLFVS